MIKQEWIRTKEDWNNEEMTKYTQEDYDFFWDTVKGLSTHEGFRGDGIDEDGVPIPYSLGVHSVKWLREVIWIVKPKRMLTIGFNLGYCTALWFKLNPKLQYLLAIDISDKRETLHSVNVLKQRHKERFDFYHFDSKRVFPILEGMKFDTCFIDGNHDLDYILNDIDLAVKLGIPNIIFDDWNPLFSDVQQALQLRPEIEMTHLITNISITKNTKA